MDFKLELVAVPVSDVDRAKQFYTEQVGFNADHDHQINENLRFVQLTGLARPVRSPSGPASWIRRPGRSRACSSWSRTSSRRGRNSRDAAWTSREIQRFPWGAFVFFQDPDGNGWAVQDVTGTR